MPLEPKKPIDELLEASATQMPLPDASCVETNISCGPFYADIAARVKADL